MKAGEVFEIIAKNEELAWSDFYAKLYPLNQKQIHTLLKSLTYRQNNNDVDL